MNNDGPLKIVHILLYWELWVLLLSQEHLNPKKESIKQHNATICIFAFYRPCLWKYKRTLMKVYQWKTHFSLCLTVFERRHLEMSPGCRGNRTEPMIKNYFHIICSQETSKAALGKKKSGLSNNRRLFYVKKITLYFLQVKYVFGKHILEKASGMDGQQVTADKKMFILKKKQGQTPHVWTVFGIQQETTFLVKLHRVLDYTAEAGTLTAEQLAVCCLYEWAPPADEWVCVTVYANYRLAGWSQMSRVLNLSHSKYRDKCFKSGMKEPI